MTLVEWSAGLPEWQRDALRRIAMSRQLEQADLDAIAARLRHAHGMPAEGDVGCIPITEAHLVDAAAPIAPTILNGIGPVRHVDRLAPNQALRFAVTGLTLIYGDNGAGKSGYARIAKKLCNARVVEELQGDVFAEQNSPPAEAQVRFQLPGEEEPQTINWVNGQPAPAALSRMMVLDTANSNVYVTRQNEIVYLPREIEIATRLGALCTKLAPLVDGESESIAQRCRGPFGVGYSETSTAGRHMRRLVLETELHQLPTVAELREAAVWNADLAKELQDLESRLAGDPAAQAQARRRAVEVLTELTRNLAEIIDGVGIETVATLAARMQALREAEGVAALAAEEHFAGMPIDATGSELWRQLYLLARRFAGESGYREPGAAFQIGDPCPVCQMELDDVAVKRMACFDDFVRGAAAEAVNVARAEWLETRERIEATRVPPIGDIDRALAEYRDFGEAEARVVDELRGYILAAGQRRESVIAADNAAAVSAVAMLPDAPTERLQAEIQRLTNEATALEAQPGENPAAVLRTAELKDSRRLAQEIEAVLIRRAELERRRQLIGCRGALDTRAISQFTSGRRRELVTPELRGRIEQEIRRLGLDHLPFKFTEETDHGKNFFDVVLDARRQASKARIMSEGEQRALGIACFFAEVGRVPGNHGIIVDDPVSSLDHLRMRIVAERLVDEAAAGRQVIVFTHHLIFYQELRSAAAARMPQVHTTETLIAKVGPQFGIISEDDQPWIAKTVRSRIGVLRDRLARLPPGLVPGTEKYRGWTKDYYTDLRETWERLVEEMLFNEVVQRYSPGVQTQRLREVVVEDLDHQTIYVNMTRASELSGHDMAAGRQLPPPTAADMRRDLDTLDNYRNQINQRRTAVRERRRALEAPPRGERR